MKYLAITLLAFFGPLSISATSLFEDNKQAEDEARLFYNNNGNMYLGLNATYIWGLAGLAAVGVAAVILYFAIAERASGFASGYNRFGEDYAHQNQNDFYQTEYETRQKRFANDVASKMAQLEQAFKKYQVEEAECEMYIACEASQVHRIEENGPLAKIVHDILSSFNRAKDSNKWDERMEGLVQAFEYGTGAHQNGQTDPCKPLRTKCFELHSKKNY